MINVLSIWLFSHDEFFFLNPNKLRLFSNTGVGAGEAIVADDAGGAG